MTNSTRARAGVLFIIACLGGSALAGCAAESAVDTAGGQTMETTVNGAPDVDADPGAPSDVPSDPGTDTQSAPDEPSNPADPGTAEEPATPEPSAAARDGAATFPKSPLTVSKNQLVTLKSSAGSYVLVVPDSYDASHMTPTSLFVWLHGCGGTASSDARVVSPGGNQSWLTISIGGRDGGCWNMDSDSKLVLSALDDVKQRLNVDPTRVVIGGYSSGGNLAYRTAFYNADRFAGVLAENTAAFYGTDSSQAASLAAAAWKLNIVHLAHTSDTTFKIATVRTETEALKKAGFPVTLIEKPGSHWDSATNSDLRTYLLPYLDAGWHAPE